MKKVADKWKLILFLFLYLYKVIWYKLDNVILKLPKKNDKKWKMICFLKKKKYEKNDELLKNENNEKWWKNDMLNRLMEAINSTLTMTTPDC